MTREITMNDTRQKLEPFQHTEKPIIFRLYVPPQHEGTGSPQNQKRQDDRRKVVREDIDAVIDHILATPWT